MRFTLPGFFGFLLFCHSASALELSLGKGDFSMMADINPLFSNDIKISTNIWSLTEKHKNIRESNFYYQFQFDYFNSDSVDKMTEFASLPASIPLPITNSSIDDNIDKYTQIPVPADYQVRGIDFNIALGYDLIKTPKTKSGFSINTGLSSPFMTIRNMKKRANLVIDLLDTFDTKVVTYKLGGGIYGEFNINKQLSLLGNTSINYQTGTMENGTLGSSIQIDGSYQTLNLGVRYHPGTLNKLYLTGGYNYRMWNYGSTTVKTPIGSAKVARSMNIDFKLTNIYLGVGYNF